MQAGGMRVVVAEEVRRATRRVPWRIMTFGVPVVLLVLAVAMPAVRGAFDGEGGSLSFSLGEGGRAFGLVDESGVTDSVPDDAPPGLQRYADRPAGLDALGAGAIEDLFIIRPEYQDTRTVLWVHAGEGLLGLASGSAAADAVGDLLMRAAVAGALDPVRAARFVQPATFETVAPPGGGPPPEPEPVAGGTAFLSTSYLLGLLLMISVFLGSGMLLESVADEKENRMMEVLLTSVSPFGLMAGKVLALGLVGLLQLAVWLSSLAVLGPLVFEGIPQLGDLKVDPALHAGMVAFFLVGYFVMAVLLAGIGAASASYRESSTLVLIVIVPAMTPLMALEWIVRHPDGLLAQTLSFVPLTAPLTMILRMGATDLPLWEVGASLAVTVVSGIGLLWLSARVFRAGMLLYGQRMSLGRAWTALREGG